MEFVVKGEGKNHKDTKDTKSRKRILCALCVFVVFSPLLVRVRLEHYTKSLERGWMIDRRMFLIRHLLVVPMDIWWRILS